MVVTTQLNNNLFDYQQRGVEKLEDRDGLLALLMEMRTGKTRLAIYYALSKTDRVLVITILSGMGVWEREARLLGYKGHIELLSEGSELEKAEIIGMMKSGIVVINYDSYWKPAVRKAILKWKPGAIIPDEAQAIKNRSSRRAKFAHVLGMQPWAKVRIPMTGTPVTNSPLDIFSIYLFMDRTIFGTNWYNFRDEYCVMGGYEGKQVVSYKNLGKLKAIVDATSYHISKSIAIPNLPPREDIVVPVTLSAKSREYYQTMLKESIVKIEDSFGESHKSVATIVLARMMRLQQITSGFIGTTQLDGRKGEVVDIGNEKLKMCCDLAENAVENGEKVIIFCRFKRDMTRIREALEVPLFHTLDGDTPGPQRKRFEEEHLKGKIPIAICQLKVASLALDLVQASIGIYYSLDFSVANFVQSKDRLHGRGQEKPVTYYYLTATKTIDERVVSDLRKNLDIAANVVSLDYVRSMLL